jgi:hypothetical protein
MTGFKGQVLFPVLAIAFSYYVIFQRITVSMFAGPAAAIVLAYAIIQPYRVSVTSSSSIDTASVTSIASHLLSGDDTTALYDYGPVLDVVARSDILGFTAAGVRFASEGPLGPDAPDFAGTIFLSPMYAFIPRLIWADKPTPATGGWFARRVLNRPFEDPTSIGMGPVAYAYFAGGAVGVFGAFMLLGAIQRLVFTGLTGCGLGGWIVYVSILQSLIVIPSDFGPTLSGLFQLVPLVLVAQYFVLRAR